MKRDKAKTIKAFGVARRDMILIDRMEPWTDEGRDDVIGSLNRPAGERMITVKISEVR